jgi:hypothetical protein
MGFLEKMMDTFAKSIESNVAKQLATVFPAQPSSSSASVLPAHPPSTKRKRAGEDQTEKAPSTKKKKRGGK